MQLIKWKRNKKSNQGNSFIVVIATISFLAVLVTALLVAVALCFRLKAYEMNSRDNFYYLEQAMDEIYEGIGSISMEHLNAAYEDTIELLVYFDPDKKTYVTMENDVANKLMKDSYNKKMLAESAFATTNALKTKLEDFITVDSKSDTFDISIDNIDKSVSGVVTIKNLVLKRTHSYSTVNNVKSNKSAATNFVQTISTDVVISIPDFNIDFNQVGDDMSQLFGYALISDMGVEITGSGTRTNITGNVYAAADFYNKGYDDAKVENITETDKTKKNMLTNDVNSYSKDKKKQQCDGIAEKSMYSGLYISGAKVSIWADQLIVPGSIAAMNCAELSVVGSVEDDATGTTKAANVWADGIVLGGYSTKAGVGSNSYLGSVINMNANAYIYDDLEVNATGSKFALNGNYYGYNYATTDNREYTSEFIAAASNRVYSTNVKINDGNYLGPDGNGGHLTGQAHYNSSSVVVNGEDTTLDLSGVKNMYIAGQAYVELSKSTTSKTYKYDKTSDSTEEVKNDTAEEEKITIDSYTYQDYNDNKDGDTSNDSYTTNNSGKDFTSVQDYRTGEGISIKSNQLAYIPPYTVKEDADGNMYVTWPKILTTTDYFKDMWSDLSKVPVIKTVVSGQVQYFYDFSKADGNISMNDYLAAYAELFERGQDEVRSTGEIADFFDITEYEDFEVNKVISAENIYSNSAISVKDGTTVTVVADSKKIEPLIEAKKVLDASIQQTLGAEVTTQSTDAELITYAGNVTKGLQQQYKEMKMLLTNKGKSEAVSNAYQAAESMITPINYYFNFNFLNGKDEEITLASGYKVYMSEDDILINESGSVKGIVLCKGDVTFDTSVTEFEGIIVSGGKIIVKHSMNFIANEEVVKSVLRECDESRHSTTNNSFVCDIFRHFDSNYKNVAAPNDTIVSMKEITAVQYEDMVSYENWKKNVD